MPTTLGPGGQQSWISGCDIPGVGFIPADVVAALVSNLETRVSRALINARTGTLVETSNPRYEITESMREFVYARDETCRMWGCNRAIHRGCTETNGDLDHAIPHREGPSCPSNLSGLCRHHHRLKHTPSWTHELHEDGRTTWTSPTGEQVETFPELWVHVGDEVSPPPEGAKEEEEKEVEEKGGAGRRHQPFVPPELPRAGAVLRGPFETAAVGLLRERDGRGRPPQSLSRFATVARASFSTSSAAPDAAPTAACDTAMPL